MLHFFKRLTFFGLLLFFACSKEPVPEPDLMIGDWTVVSLTDEEGKTIVWQELVDRLVKLIPEYKCMSYTATVSKKLVSTNYIFIDVNARGCLSPVLAIHTWSKTKDTNQYEFTQGTVVTPYTITFSENDQRMTWKENKSGIVTVWERK